MFLEAELHGTCSRLGLVHGTFFFFFSMDWSYFNAIAILFVPMIQPGESDADPNVGNTQAGHLVSLHLGKLIGFLLQAPWALGLGITSDHDSI